MATPHESDSESMTENHPSQQDISETPSSLSQSQNEESKGCEASEKPISDKLTKDHAKFDHSDLNSTKLELHDANKNSFVWINKILCYSFKHSYAVVHDLMKGLVILSFKDGSFKREELCLIDSSLVLVSHAINNSMFITQDDTGMLYLVSAVKKKLKKTKVWALCKKAQFFLNERVTSFYTLPRGESKSKDVVMCTSEGTIYTLKLLEKKMSGFMTKIQYKVLYNKLTEHDDREQLLKDYENGFENAFDGNTISEFFNIDLKEMKSLLNDIKQENQKDNKSELVNFNLLNIKMLFI